jgi:hypothetical protein
MAAFVGGLSPWAVISWAGQRPRRARPCRGARSGICAPARSSATAAAEVELGCPSGRRRIDDEDLGLASKGTRNIHSQSLPRISATAPVRASPAQPEPLKSGSACRPKCGASSRPAPSTDSAISAHDLDVGDIRVLRLVHGLGGEVPGALISRRSPCSRRRTCTPAWPLALLRM